jgi:ferritin-like metal-binding protein YciE
LSGLCIGRIYFEQNKSSRAAAESSHSYELLGRSTFANRVCAAAAANRARNQAKEFSKIMANTTPKDVFVRLLSDLRNGSEKHQKVFEELGEAAQNPQIKEALDARQFISTQVISRLDECFRLIGEKPVKGAGRLQDVFMEDTRKELNEIHSPMARRIFVLAKAARLMHLRIGEYVALIAAADTTGHPAVGVLLESCLADNLAFAERTRRLIREHLQEKAAAA